MRNSRTFNFHFYYKLGDDFGWRLAKAAEALTKEGSPPPGSGAVTAEAFRVWAESLKNSSEECLKLAAACDGKDIEGDGDANCVFLYASGSEAIAALEALANDDTSVSIDECHEAMDEENESAEYVAYMSDPENYAFWDGKVCQDPDKINLFVAETEDQALAILRQELDNVRVLLLTNEFTNMELVGLDDKLDDVWLVPRDFSKEKIISFLAAFYDEIDDALLDDKANYVFWNGRDPLTPDKINIFVAETDEHAKETLKREDLQDEILFVFVRGETTDIHWHDEIVHVPSTLEKDALIPAFIEFLKNDDDDEDDDEEDDDDEDDDDSNE